ncbi:bacteriohemerythrin [uncultured Pseudodesulfovibrio sp.]|uniref:bacteriohemerythrin n=1 Tax=uncultured Pseudodesulfovibrio sp. TaxID=2035858 RepID=UPI0029C89F0A|nr:bacteriohemerythrin [uncultured Pseudodesulfovibrio sp.]
MSFITFTKKNMIDVPEIDNQHNQLFEILNMMHAATVEGQEQAAIIKIFDDLISYTVDHFDTEEQYMMKHEYSGYAGHKKEHDELTAQAVELQNQFKDGSATVTFELLDFLNEWLNNHTMGTDQDMGKFLRDMA